jgi:uncharacterized protein DUF5681
MSDADNDDASAPDPANDPNQTEKVGYRRPPRAYTWKAGQSGNPTGRRKGSKNESTVVREVLTRKIETRVSGRPQKLTVLEAIILKIAEDALKGNTKSAQFLLNRFAALVSGELQPQDMSEDDQAVLEAFARRAATRDLPGELS